MRKNILSILVLFFAVFFTGFSSKNNNDILHPKYLRCENLIDPLGIDVVNPRLSWYSDSQQRAQTQVAYQILVASSLGQLNANNGDLWDSKKIFSDQSINIIYKGKQLTSEMQCYWKVKVWDNKGNESAWSQSAKWTLGLLYKTDWNANWIGLDKAIGNDKPDTECTILSARLLRKEFETKKIIKRATAYICGLGLFELYSNGHKIGDQVLAPALSEYSKRSFYNTFDVTNNLSHGKNVIGVILGNGRFFAMRHTNPIGMFTYGFPKMIFRLNIEYTDNTSETIVSDTTWKITTDGPITANNEYDGEVYDARKELSGWNRVGFDDSKWIKAEKVAEPSEKLSAQMIEPIKIMQTIKPKSVKEIKHGVYIFDMGQNMVGWVSLKVRANKGTNIEMRFAETLKPDGDLYTANLRSARQEDIYITKGGDQEKWEPRFTYHGFRYVELTGFPGKPDLNTIEGKVVYNDIRTIGNFSCSNEILNKIYNNAYWGIRGNYRSIPTDCPQRDERQGWLGDRSMNSYGESFIFNNDLLYSNWMTDIADVQKDNGSIPDVAPAYWQIYSDNMTWPSSIIIIPDNIYRQYGNIKVIADNYDVMKKWLFYMRDKYMKDYLLPKDTYGDWCMPPESPELIHSKDPSRITPGDFIGSSYFYYCLRIMERNAQLLNKNEDAKEYTSLADKVRDAINNTFLNKDSLYYANNTVTANALALFFGIPSEEIKSKVFDNLVYKTTHDFKSHTSTGLVGGQWIMRTLTDNGNPDLAFKIATNKDFPSWGYMAEHGATTIWELWNGNTADPAMNSGNHVMLLGDLVIWYYEDLAGIKSDPSNPAFKHLIMKPYPLNDLKFVKASYLSMYGLIKSEWHSSNTKFDWDINIPANTSATIYIPAEKEGDVTENGKDVLKNDGVKFVKLENGRAVYEIGSGSYHFTSKLNKQIFGGLNKQGTGKNISASGVKGSRIVAADEVKTYPDNRPSAKYRLEAVDHGVVYKHGDGPDSCDYLGARDIWVWKYKDTYYLNYDGAGLKGWLACLAVSKDLVNWKAKGPVLQLGKTGSDDCASASYGTVFKDGVKWNMFYLGTPHTTPAPDYIPAFPYLTMKAEGKSPTGPWIKRYDIRPFLPTPDSYNSSTASPGYVIKQNNEYLMFFSASTDTPKILRTLSIARTRNLDSSWVLDLKPIFPSEEQVENSSLYYEKANKTYFIFTNHVGLKDGLEYTDAIWVYWSKDLTKWNPADKAVVLDSHNCKWSKHIIGLPSVVQVGNRLAILYDGNEASEIPPGVKSHMNRDIGLAWLNLPLILPGQ
jgi:alpha-L-rhamnosidase